MAAIRFSAFGFRQRWNYPALRPLVAFRTSDPENLPLFCCGGCSSTDLGVVG
jgi:hypothetical protein